MRALHEPPRPMACQLGPVANHCDGCAQTPIKKTLTLWAVVREADGGRWKFGGSGPRAKEVGLWAAATESKPMLTQPRATKATDQSKLVQYFPMRFHARVSTRELIRKTPTGRLGLTQPSRPGAPCKRRNSDLTTRIKSYIRITRGHLNLNYV